MPYPAPRNSKAQASFILGILSFFVAWPILSILAICLGKSAQEELRLRPNPASQQEAQRGIKMGIISLCIGGGIIVLVLLVFLGGACAATQYAYR
jgi:hypothetical protein